MGFEKRAVRVWLKPADQRPILPWRHDEHKNRRELRRERPAVSLSKQ
jgi:hypothetical protein